jgi:predicted nuclease with TOPRIM domain
MKMTYMAVLAISMIILWAGGCQEEQASPDVKMARLTALENKELQAQLQAEKKKCDDDINKINNEKAQLQAEIKKRDDEIKNLNAQFAAGSKNLNDEFRDIQKQLDECQQVKSVEMQKESDKEVWGMVTDLAQKNEELTAEVERLKAELAKAKGEEKK